MQEVTTLVEFKPSWLASRREKDIAQLVAALTKEGAQVVICLGPVIIQNASGGGATNVVGTHMGERK